MSMKAVRTLPLVLAILCAAPAAARETEALPRVVLVVLGGGVTRADMSDETRMPWLASAASLHLTLEAEAGRPHQGAIELLTGRPDPRTGGGHPPPEHPTLMERVREGLRLSAERVWFVSYAGGDALALAFSTDPDLGRAVAPSVCTGEGAFGAPLEPLLETLGRPVPTEDATWTLLRRLRVLGLEGLGARRPEAVDAASPRAERVERALLAEIDRRAALVRGPVARDVRALRAASTVLAVHRPVLTVVRLGDLTLVREDGRRPPSLAAVDVALAAFHRRMTAEGPAPGDSVLLVVGEPYHPGGDAAREDVETGLAVVGGRWRGPRSGRGRLADVAATVLDLLGAGGPPGTDASLLRPRGR